MKANRENTTTVAKTAKTKDVQPATQEAKKKGRGAVKERDNLDPQLERMQKLCAYLLEAGMARTLREIGRKMGYLHNHTFYTMLYHKDSLTPKMLIRLAAAYPTVNISYITDGEGPMLNKEADAIAKVAPRRVDRFLLFLTMSSISIKDAVARLGWDMWAWYGIKKSASAEMSDRQMDQVLKAFPDLNRSWLNSGKGNMLKNDVDAPKRDLERQLTYLMSKVERLEKENAAMRKQLNTTAKKK